MSVKRVVTATTLSACLATGLLAVSAPAAQAQAKAGCVNKKTNELRILLKASKKCKKGWQKITFNQPGATGAPGPAGSAGPVSVVNVKDANGALVGQSFLSVSTWLTGSVLVYRDGGAFYYTLGSGKVISEEWDSVLYTDASCSPAGAVFPVYDTPAYLAALSSFGRIIDRPNLDLPARAFKGTSTVRAIAPTDVFWYPNSSGICTAGASMWSNTYVVLTPVPAPPDHPGPLSLG